MTDTPTKPDDAIVRALLGDTDLRERTAAIAAEVYRLTDETRDLRERTAGLLQECAAFESAVGERVATIIDLSTSTLTPKPNLKDGVLALVSALLGAEELYNATYMLGEYFPPAAENPNCHRRRIGHARPMKVRQEKPKHDPRRRPAHPYEETADDDRDDGSRMRRCLGLDPRQLHALS